jgi:hypothetical protein
VRGEGRKGGGNICKRRAKGRKKERDRVLKIELVYYRWSILDTRCSWSVVGEAYIGERLKIEKQRGEFGGTRVADLHYAWKREGVGIFKLYPPTQ